MTGDLVALYWPLLRRSINNNFSSLELAAPYAAFLLAKDKRTVMVQSTQVLQHADQLVRCGLLHSALAALKRQLQRTPDEGRLWELKGLILHKSNCPLHAVAAFENASLLVPLSTAGQMAWADSYLLMGKPERALPLVPHLIRRADLPTACLPLLAGRFARFGATSGAQLVCRAWVRRQPQSDAAHFALAVNMIRLDQSPPRVLRVLRKAIALAPHCWRYQFTLAQYLLQYEGAPSAYETLMAIPCSALALLPCRCCVDRLYELCLQFEDYERCSVLAARRVQLAECHDTCL